MLISIDWVKDFVNIPDMNPRELGDKFTMSTAEVEEVNVIGAHLEKITVAEVVEIEPHPNADKLRLVTFKVTEKEKKKVVCGAPNVKVGMKTPYAPLGTTLPNGLLLEPKKIRGVVSEGMLCSESELGISEESAGIMELDAGAVVGETLLKLFNEIIIPFIIIFSYSLLYSQLMDLLTLYWFPFTNVNCFLSLLNLVFL